MRTIFNRLHRPAMLALVTLPLLAALGCKEKQKAIAAERPANPNQVSITPALERNLKFGVPEMMEVDGTLQVSAHVETDAHRIVRVGSPVSGRILDLRVFEGQKVRAGTVLAMLHSTDLSDTQLALIKASSQRGLAAAAEKRAEQLVEAEVIGRAELERRRAADYPILTPRSGTVLKREITIGQVVQPADPAFTIADLSSIWIVANVPEEDAGQLQKNMQVQVHIPALPQQKMTGRLSFVSPIVDPATRTVEVHMDVANADGLLKPDELASMTLSGKPDRKLSVPNASVVREDNHDYVFVQQGEHAYVLRPVTLGDEENDRRVVVSGVAAEDRIVTEGAFHLNNQRKQNAIKGGA
jgi:cobalt-zinc-cadmium efflux system membrane fusion protein